MSTNSLHLELPSAERPSLIPWIVVLACAAVLLLLTAQLANRIPATLQQQAVKMLSDADYPNVTVSANGRELQLSGSILINQPVQPLIDQLSLINGVQSVTHKLTVVDPAVQAQLAAERFLAELANIDIDQVAFQPGSVSFTSQSDAALAQLLALLKQYPQGRVRIEGHTDNTGPDTVNLRVSRDRAAAVANYLMARGIPADQLIVKGYGSTQPIADNSTDTGRARNRRIEISPIN